MLRTLCLQVESIHAETVHLHGDKTGDVCATLHYHTKVREAKDTLGPPLGWNTCWLNCTL